MTSFEPLGLTVLIKAVDFLFDEAGKLLQELRQQRKSQLDSTKSPQDKMESRGATRKDEILSRHPNLLSLDETTKEINHCLSQIHQYSQNKRTLETQIALHGGLVFAPLPLQNQLQQTDDEIEKWCVQLKRIVEEVYEYDIALPGFD